MATAVTFLFQVSGVGYNGVGHVTMAGQILTPNSNLSITKVLEVKAEILLLLLSYCSLAICHMLVLTQRLFLD